MKKFSNFITETHIVYRKDLLYDEFLEKIKLLPEEDLKELIEKFNSIRANNELVNIDKLIKGEV